MKTREYIVFSACSMILTALGIDIMLPALGAMRADFHISEASTAGAQVISFFFMGQAGQILFGPLSDRWGRLTILRMGFPLYILAGLGAAFSGGITEMLIYRFIAGMGASAIFTATIAGVRDRFRGDSMARIMSLILTIFLFTPVLAPFLGAAILTGTSWKTVFITPPIFAALIFVWSFRMQESLPSEARQLTSESSFLHRLRKILTHGTFLRYAGITTLLFTAFSAFIASSEHLVGEIYGKPEWFTWIFSGTGVAMACCSFFNSRLVSKFGARKTLRALLVLYFGVAIFLLALSFGKEPPPMALFFGGMTLITGLNIAIEPNSSALALEPLGGMAGLAASVYGTSFFFIGGGIGAIISYFLTNGVLPLTASFFVIGMLTLILERGGMVRMKNPSPISGAGP